MDRRFLSVLGISLVFALVVSTVFYQMTARARTAPRKAEKVELRDLVVAARALSAGASIRPDDLKVTKVPVAQFPKGAFSKAEEILDRPVASKILADEPVLEGRLAARGSGLGLGPVIPVGMRAVTVSVNEVVGVAGFALPGMRVDILVTGNPPDGRGRTTHTVLQNILVLSAGTAMAPDSRGQPIQAHTVTLLVTPDQAEMLTLAGNEGRIHLVLRNANDHSIENTQGREVAELYGGRRSRVREEEQEEAPRPQPKRSAAPAAAPAPPPPPPPPDEVVVIRGTTKTVEVVGGARPSELRNNQ